MEKITIYVLKLEQEKYYVGKTRKTVQERYVEHISGKGSEWTRLYKPIKILEEIQDCDKFDEDKYVKKFMSKYGIENVRGGSYTTIMLTHEQKELLEKEITAADDRCFNCKES